MSYPRELRFNGVLRSSYVTNYYCQYHKYNGPNSTHPYFKAWVTYKPTGKHYWESFYWHK